MFTSFSLFLTYNYIIQYYRVIVKPFCQKSSKKFKFFLTP
nr:MAG TPA: hypothetical protein [Caudoviricetes sp.]